MKHRDAYTKAAEAFLSFVVASTVKGRSQDELAEAYRPILKWNPNIGYREKLQEDADSLPWKTVTFAPKTEKTTEQSENNP
jgi:hypothetical protein